MKEPSERAHIPHASTFWSQKYPDVVTQKIYVKKGDQKKNVTKI